MTTSTEKLYVHIDSDLQQCIDKAIALEKEQIHFDSHSNQWMDIQYELDERLQEIGNMIIWEYRHMPF